MSSIITLEEGWDNQIKPIGLDVLERILEEGIHNQTKKLFNNEDFSKIYTTCYNMCIQKAPYNWTEKIYDLQSENIAKYLEKYVVPALTKLKGEELLLEFVKRGDNHAIMTKWYSNFFAYLNRYHVKFQQLRTVSSLASLKFKTIVYDKVKKQVTEELLTLIENERDNLGIINRDLIKKCIKIYEQMNIENVDSYELDFENAFIEATRNYYEKKSKVWIQEETTPTYLQRVENILETEKERVLNYLVSTTEIKLLNTLDQVLLSNNEHNLLNKEGSGLMVILQNIINEDGQKHIDDLSRLYRLFSRINNGIDQVTAIFKTHILQVCKASISNRIQSIKAESEKNKKDKSAESTIDDTQIIVDLLILHDKYMKITSGCFNNNAHFQRALKDAFVEFVNSDGIDNSDSKLKFIDLLVAYTDKLLKTSSSEKLNDNELEDQLSKIIQIFNYLVDKDMFAESYRNALAKRILQQRSSSDDMERSMIGKMKLTCGAQFTGKMEGMMNDLSICNDTLREWESFVRENPDNPLKKIEFSAQVLTTGHWPKYKAFDEIVLPEIMKNCIRYFETFYSAKTSHRRLAWTYSLGHALIKIHYQNKPRSYEAQVTTLQAIVMLAFNPDALSNPENTPITFNDLMNALKFPEDVLKKVLHSLTCGKYKIFKKVEGNDNEKIIKNTDSFIFNESFQSQIKKFRIPMANLDDSSGVKKVQEDRSIAIEACIVRIMKARKTLPHQQLVAEILSQLSFFQPDTSSIKKRIESLIEREYLVRDEQNSAIYKYVA